jgi:SnoaL-like domain
MAAVLRPARWLVDQPTFFLPDGSSFKVRLTMVMRQEDERWKTVHGHSSVGVPDEEGRAAAAVVAVGDFRGSGVVTAQGGNVAHDGDLRHLRSDSRGNVDL